MQSVGLVLLSSQQAVSRTMDVIANNVANSNTTGFKREGVAFSTYTSQPNSPSALNFVVDRASYRDVTNGPIESTSNPLDLAISGQGYFTVKSKTGIQYTRGGSFEVDNQGQIVTQSGDPVLDDGGQPVIVPDTAEDINVSNDGTITAKIAGQTALTQLGKFQLVKFDNEQQMKSQGGGLYSTDQASSAATDTKIMQGALEQSNVKPVMEMTQMMQVMRSYEQAFNLINQENSRLDDAISKLSKTTA